ncbi:unnamed protein product [Brachionus calyciflorus]|uniref:Cystatin domain-containing protein n=1 Tax=Brachionus calyciflorus TaxID=104777 RepID=A0A814PUC2_9BILA|nr:unnamed protein product [Brachionus calyciflorus]
MQNQENQKMPMFYLESSDSIEFDQKDLCNITLSANPRIQYLIEELAEEIRAKSGKDYEDLEAISYRSDIVIGTNYFIKVRSADEYFHVRVFCPYPYYFNSKELASVQTGKTKNDKIEKF